MKSGCKKICIILTIVIVLLGMVLLGIFGLNQTVDYKKSYEVRVGVDVNVNNSGEIAKDSAEKYFKDNGIKFLSYATQESEDGAMYIYKFSKKPEFDVEALKTAVQTALSDNSDTSALVAKVDGIYETETTNYGAILGVTLTVAISAVVVLVYLFFTEKGASSLASVCGGIISAIVFLSLMSITRVPALSTVAVSIVFAFTLALVYSIVIVNRYKEITKIVGNEKMSKFDVAIKGTKQGLMRIIFVSLAVVVVMIPFLFFGSLALTFIALQLIIATISAVVSSLFWTPFIWTALKK